MLDNAFVRACGAFDFAPTHTHTHVTTREKESEKEGHSIKEERE